MSKIARTIGAAVVSLASVATVQAGPLSGFRLKAQTEHFAFYTRGNEKVDAQKSEKFLARIQQMLGHAVRGRAEYYRYSRPEDIAAGTGTYAAGLTFAQAGQIHSTLDFHAHEIVHLVAGQMGNPGSFFQEGLAVALGNGAKWNGQDVHKAARSLARSATIAQLVAGFDRMDPQVSYAAAGSF